MLPGSPIAAKLGIFVEGARYSVVAKEWPGLHDCEIGLSLLFSCGKCEPEPEGCGAESVGRVLSPGSACLTSVSSGLIFAVPSPYNAAAFFLFFTFFFLFWFVLDFFGFMLSMVGISFTSLLLAAWFDEF